MIALFDFIFGKMFKYNRGADIYLSCLMFSAHSFYCLKLRVKLHCEGIRLYVEREISKDKIL